MSIPACTNCGTDLDVEKGWRREGEPVKWFCPKCGPVSTPLDTVDHPPHYGGDTTFEAIKVIEAWGLGFCLGNALKYIARCDHKGTPVEDLEKARWYIEREIQQRRLAE